MPILITGASVDLDALAGELLTSRASEAQRTAAARALREANPGLSARVDAGTPVVLPDLPHRRARLDHVGTVAGATRLGDLEAMLAPLPATLADRAAHAKSRTTGLAAGAKTARAAVTDAQLRRFLTKNRESAAARRVRDEAKEAAGLAEVFSDAAPRWAEELAALKALLLRTG